LLARSAAPLIARNAGHRLELLERCGATLTAEQAGKLIDKRRRSGTLIGVRQGGSWHYPGCQFGEQRHEVIAGLPRLLEAMPKSSPRVVLDFLLAPDQTLNGRTPLEVLRAEGWTGDLDRLVRIEHGDGFAWAARRRYRVAHPAPRRCHRLGWPPQTCRSRRSRPERGFTVFTGRPGIPCYLDPALATLRPIASTARAERSACSIPGWAWPVPSWKPCCATRPAKW
jgi:hypothetical protein